MPAATGESGALGGLDPAAMADPRISDPKDGRAPDPAGGLKALARRWRRWRNARIASPAFQARAARFPLTRPFARKSADALYDLVSGFVYSQVLGACVELGIFEMLRDGPASSEDIARRAVLPEERARRLLRAGAALKLIEIHDGLYELGPLGAAALGAPGVAAMIRHHRLFYDDLRDPTALLRGEVETRIAGYWPYVGGGVTSDMPAEIAVPYSELMAVSQASVAAETLRSAPFRGARRVLDVGGGAGAFLMAALERQPGLTGMVFDLPAVAAEARARIAARGLADRATAIGGSFRDDPLPDGADAISLIRVLYDHDDAVAAALLRKVFRALPPGGRVLVSEPMSGGDAPERAGDVYFAFYTLAMTTGRARSAAEHGALLAAAGFGEIRRRPVDLGFVTGVISARKPA